MGERAGYRIREGDKVSHLLRKQWQIGDMEEMVTSVARTLLCGDRELCTIGGGLVALRPDLGLGRLAAALYYVVYEPPYDSIETDPAKCDIYDHGIYEIELIHWDHWKVWIYDPDMFEGHLIADVSFEDGKTLQDGMTYKKQQGAEWGARVVPRR